jgi:hypothetical protein
MHRFKWEWDLITIFNQFVASFVHPFGSKNVRSIDPYYTVEYMRKKVKKATKKAILQQIVEPHWHQISPSQQESIRSLLEQLTS